MNKQRGTQGKQNFLRCLGSCVGLEIRHICARRTVVFARGTQEPEGRGVLSTPGCMFRGAREAMELQ